MSNSEYRTFIADVLALCAETFAECYREFDGTPFRKLTQAQIKALDVALPMAA